MIGASEMLRKLGSGVRPGEGVGAHAAPIERRGFEELLARAGAGELSSGRRVKIAAGVDGEIDEHALEALSSAADAAEAAGAKRLLALIEGVGGGVAAHVDVASREIRAVERRANGGVLTGFDAAVVIGGETDAEDDGAGSARGPVWWRNEAVGEILARGVRDADAEAAQRCRVG